MSQPMSEETGKAILRKLEALEAAIRRIGGQARVSVEIPADHVDAGKVDTLLQSTFLPVNRASKRDRP